MTEDLGSAYQSHRQDFEQRSLIDAARERMAQAQVPKPNEEVRPFDTGGFGSYRDGVIIGGGATEADAWSVFRGAGEAAVGAAKDVAKGVATGDVAKQALLGGPADAMRNALKAIDDAANWLDENVANLKIVEPGPMDQLMGRSEGLAGLVPEVAEARTVTGGLARDISQFMVGFLPLLKGLKGVTGATSALGKMAEVEGAAAIASALVLDPMEDRLSNLVQSVPALQNPVTEYLAAKPEDTAADGRFKNAIEGLGLGAAAEGVVRAVKALKFARAAKQTEPDAAAQQAAYGTVQQRDFMVLGDPAAPLVQTKPTAAAKLVKATDATAGTDAQSVLDRVRAALNFKPRTLDDMDAVDLAEGDAGITDLLGILRGKNVPKGTSLTQWLVSKGGLKNQGGEVMAVLGTTKARPGLLNKNGMNLDDAARAAWEEGYMPDFPERPDINDFIEALREDHAKRSVRYGNTLSDRDMEALRASEDLDQILNELDVDLASSSDADIVRRLRRFAEEGEATPRTQADLEAEAAAMEASGYFRVKGTEGDVYINFARISTPDDVKALMGQMADTFRASLDEARRGVQSNAETKRLANELGMTVDDVLQRRQGQPFNAEEALAARRLWAASATKLKQAAEAAASPNAGDVDQFNFRKMMAIHYAIQAEVIGARTETARALQAWSIPVGEGTEMARSIKIIMDTAGGPAVSKAMAQRIAMLQGADVAALNAVARKGWAATTMDAVKEAYVLGLLWAPPTHIVNTASNMGVAFQQIYERAAASQISRGLGREDGVVAGEAAAMAYAAVSGLRDAFRMAGRALRTGETGASMGKVDLPREPAISSEAFRIASDTGLGRAVDFIGNVVRVPGTVMASQDEFFKSIGYRMELHAQSLRQATSEGLKGEALGQRVAAIVNNPPEHIRIAAADAALYSTFTNPPGTWGQALMALRNSGDLNPTFMVLPFVRTPMNILRYSFERSPVAPLVGQWRADIKAGGARADLALARMATGSTLMMLAADFAASGMLTGAGPRDQGEREALIRQGWQPYSFKVGDKWYSYKRTDPYGMLFGFAADVTEAMTRGEIDEEDMDEWQEMLAGGIAAVSHTVVDKTYFEGLSRVIEAMTAPERFAPSYVNNLTASFVPFTSALGFTARSIDATAREVNTPWDAVISRLPGLSSRLTPKRDLWGKEMKPDAVYGSGFDLVSPVAVRQVKDSAIDAEMQRLGMDVRRIAKKADLGGVPVNFRDYPEAYDDYVRLAGNDLKHPAWNLGAKEFLDEVVGGKHALSQVYAILSDGKEGGKAGFIRNTIQEYRKLAAGAVLQKHDRLAQDYGVKVEKKQQSKMPVLH